MRLIQDFVPASQFIAPELSVGDQTPMGEAIALGIELIRNRKAAHKATGVPYYRPLIVLITDGEPTDDWLHALSQVRLEESGEGIVIIAVGVGDANFSVLESIGGRKPLKFEDFNLDRLFELLAHDLKRLTNRT